MDFNFRQQMVGITVKKAPKPNKFYIEGIEEGGEDMLSKRQLFQLLSKLVGTEPEEVAFMLLEMKENPQFTEGHFGVNGLFLYCK